MSETYKTHTGLTLARDQALVTLSGENRKVLYEGDESKSTHLKKAQKVFEDTKAHYEERKKNEVK